LKLIRENENLENILKLPKMSEAKIDFDIDNVRKIFKEPLVTEDYNLNWSSPDIEGIVEFLSNERGFSEARVRTALTKVLKKAEDKKKQPTLDSFFSGES
jgi:flap endonuclease-1